MRWRRAALLAAATTLLGATAAAGEEGWHSAQPPPPAPSAGQAGIGAPIPLGHIGDIEFWAPNRGLLITSGNEAIKGGLYYYDGVSWRELSTVCGGADGRIAWAGPDDFWTISDQPVGQQLGSATSALIDRDRSLCHFEDGKVVASYAEPIGVAGSYESMDAAACSGPSDCWFGGERLPAGANSGAFHLHWNGQTLSAVPSLETPEAQLEDPGREVAHIAAFRGRFYESVQVQQGDQPGPSETSQPFLLHRIVEGSSKPFEPLIVEGPLVESPRVPGEREPFSYGTGAIAQELSGFAFSSDGRELWALAGPHSGTGAHATALLLRGNAFEQVRLKDPSGVFAPGYEIGGVAAEPGGEDAWVSVDPPNTTSSAEVAHVARVRADGTVESEQQLPQPSEEIAHKGVAQAIACPLRGDCWMAPSGGWLFHLGGDQPRDEDPYFQGLITYRPPDASIPFVAPESFPEDNSGANPPRLPAPAVTNAQTTVEGKMRAPLFSHVSERLVGAATLAITFTLATRSRVELVALRRKRAVAHTRRYVLARGRHTLELRLRRQAWPTKLDLRVRAIGPAPLVPAGSQGGEAAGGPTVVTTAYRYRRPRAGAWKPAIP